MEICISCLENSEELKSYLFCGLCFIELNVCIKCYEEWPIFLSDSNYGRYTRCSITCVIETIAIHGTFFIMPNILIEHQEEILYESRKPIVKALIKELNYFINDILNEIIEY